MSEKSELCCFYLLKDQKIRQKFAWQTSKPIITFEFAFRGGKAVECLIKYFKAKIQNDRLLTSKNDLFVGILTN